MAIQLRMISIRKIPMRTMWRISKVRSADASNAAVLTSSENSEITAKRVIKI